MEEDISNKIEILLKIIKKLKEFVSETVPNLEINIEFHRILDKQIKCNRRKKQIQYN